MVQGDQSAGRADHGLGIVAAQTEAWVARRLRSAGVQADEDAVRYLAERVEGNLLGGSAGNQ
ncbi:MAG: hypothetical protein R3E89_06390 [Thiolinea sp.]